MNKELKYPLNINQKLLLIFLLLPFHQYCGSYIATALTKVILVINPSLRISSLASVFINYFYDGILALLCIYVFFNIIKEQRQRFKKYSITEILELVIVSIIALFALNLIGSYISRLCVGSSSSSNQQAITTLLDTNKVSMTVLCALIGPLAEELYYRVGWYSLVAQINKPLGYIVSSLMFGLSHVLSYILAGNFIEIYQVFPYFFMGLALAYIYDHYESFMANYIVHGVFNLIACLF